MVPVDCMTEIHQLLAVIMLHFLPYLPHQTFPLINHRLIHIFHLPSPLRHIQLLSNKIYLLDINYQLIKMDQEAAKAAAKRLFQRVNFTGGPLQSYEVASLLTDTYEYLKIPFKPTSRDIKTYTEVLDANKDGQVTLADLQAIAVQFLCGPGVLSGRSFDNRPKYESSNVSTSSYATSLIKPNNKEGQYFQTYNIKEIKPETPREDQSPYNQKTLQYLTLTRRIFEHYADSHFTITANEVSQVLAETYQTLGRKGYRPNEQDVRVWMKLCDGNGDGHVEYEQYEYFVVRSLERSGFAIYK